MLSDNDSEVLGPLVDLATTQLHPARGRVYKSEKKKNSSMDAKVCLAQKDR